MYYVYIFASRRHGTLYIGVTNSLSKRMELHRNGEGSSFVKTYGVIAWFTSRRSSGRNKRLPAKSS